MNIMEGCIKLPITKNKLEDLSEYIKDYALSHGKLCTGHIKTEFLLFFTNERDNLKHHFCFLMLVHVAL